VKGLASPGASRAPSRPSSRSLAALLVGGTYLFVCVYAIVKLIGDSDGHPDPATLIVGFVAIPTVLVIGLFVGIRFLGTSLISRKRPEEDSEWNA
jgi:hypothetical protein